MVYKKFIKKDGKLYGPYLYHSVKKNGKVTTNYIGRPEALSEVKSKGKTFVKSNKFLIIFLFIVAFALLLNLTLNINLFPTGKVSSDIQGVYVEGQNLKGQVNLILKQGELFPSDSQVVIDNGGNAGEYLLSSLIYNEKVTGNFYVEGKEINGSGEGYGIPGEKEVFPNVLFSFKLVSSFEAGNISVEENVSGSAGSAGGAGGEFDVGVVVNETQTGPINNESVPSNETTPVNETPVQEPEQSSDEEVTSETPIQEPPIQETPAETTQPPTETTVPSETIAPSEEPPAETPSETPGDSSASTDTSTNEGVSITGEAIGEDIIEGVVSKNSPYEYMLPKGMNVEVVNSSQSVSFEIIDGKAVFKTEYSEIQQGYGQEFMGEETLVIPISLDNLSIKAKEGTLKISFSYQETELTSSTKKISVKPLPIINQTNETLILNITNVTAQNITNFTKIEKINKLLEKKIKLERKALDALRVDEKVRVIIKTKLGAISIGEKLDGLEDYEVVELDEFNIELLDENEVDEIIVDQPVSALISDSETLIRSVDVRNDFGLSGLGKKICIIDTGVDGSVTPYVTGWDFVNNDNDASDDNGHGTQVAYIAKSVAPQAELLIAKVLDVNGQGYESSVLEGLQWCVDNGANIISFSIGSGDYNGFCDSNVVADLANSAVSQGIFVVAATGNDASTSLKSPACASSVARVSATDKSDVIASFSNVNEALDVFAPGKDISTQTLGGSVTSISGTSASVPFVSGAAALVLENESLAPLDLRYRFASTGKPIPYNEINLSRLDVYNAILNITTIVISNATLNQTILNVTNYESLAEASINLVNPSNNYYNGSTPINILFRCDVTGETDGLQRVEFWSNISGNWQKDNETLLAPQTSSVTNHYSTTSVANGDGSLNFTRTYQPNGAYGKDAYVWAAYSDNENQIPPNYGDDNVLLFRENYRAYPLLEFDLSNLNGINPDDLQANLTLTLSSGAMSLEVRRVNQAWAESTVSWSSLNPPVNIGSFIYDEQSTGSSTSFNVTQLVKEWLTGTSNYGLALFYGGGTYTQGAFYSSDDSTPSNYPKLVVTYRSPASAIANFSKTGITEGKYRWTCKSFDVTGSSNEASQSIFNVGRCGKGTDCSSGLTCVNNTNGDGICRASCETYSGYACSAGAGLISTGTCQDDFLGVSSCVASGFLSMDCRNDNPNYFGAGADLTDNCVLGGDISYTAHDFQSYDSCDSAVGGNFVQDGLVGVVTSSAVCVTADCVWDAGGVVASCAYSGSTLEVNEGKDCAISPHTSGDFTPEGKLDPNTSPAHCATCAGYLDDAAYGSTCERACSMTMNNNCDELSPGYLWCDSNSNVVYQECAGTDGCAYNSAGPNDGKCALRSDILGSSCNAASSCDGITPNTCTVSGTFCTSTCSASNDKDSSQTYCTSGGNCGAIYSWISATPSGNYPCCGDDGANDDWDRNNTAAITGACYNGALRDDGYILGKGLAYDGYIYECGGDAGDDGGAAQLVSDCGQAAVSGYYCDADASTTGSYWILGIPNSCSCNQGTFCNLGYCIDTDGTGPLTGSCQSGCNSAFSGYECSNDIFPYNSVSGGVCAKDFPTSVWTCDAQDASYLPFPLIPTSTHFESCYDPFQALGTGPTSVVACDSDVSDSLGTLGYIENGKCVYNSGSLFSQGNYECDVLDVCIDSQNYYRGSCVYCYVLGGSTVFGCDSNGGSTYLANSICARNNIGYDNCDADEVCFDDSNYRNDCSLCSILSSDVDACDTNTGNANYLAEGYCTSGGTCSIGPYVYESAGLLYDGCTNGLGNRCDSSIDGSEDGSWNNYADGVCVVGSTCDVDNVCKKVTDYYGVMSSCTDGDNCDYDVGNNGFEPDGKVCSSQCVVDGSVAPLGACCQNANCNQVGGFPFCANGGTINGAPYGKACCDAATDCYANGACYNAGEVYAGSPYSYYCEAGTWDAIPYVTLDAPLASSNPLTERTPTFTWTGHDEEASPLVYRFKLIRKNFCPIESDIIDWDTASSAFYTPSNPLSCFYNTAPDDFYYEWSAEASDDNGVRWGPWATPRRLEIREVVSIILNRNPVDFGTLAYNGIDDTADNSPLPFVLENDGNVIVDVDLYAGIPGTPDPLWNTQPSTSAYFKYKADNYIGPPDESGSFNVLSSITSWTNTPVGELNKQIFLVDFNWDNTKDSSEIDLFVQVPGTQEGAGARSSTITFTATSKE